MVGALPVFMDAFSEGFVASSDLLVTARGGTSDYNVFGTVPGVTGPIYFSLRAKDIDATSAVLVVQEGDADVEQAASVTMIMGRQDGSDTFYRLHVPSTAPYRWMRIVLRAFPTGQLFVKCGSRPSKSDYDWVWSYPRHVDGPDIYNRHWFISAQDDAFQAGYFYFWYSYSSPRAPEIPEDSLRVSLETWAPRLI